MLIYSSIAVTTAQLSTMLVRGRTFVCLSVKETKEKRCDSFAEFNPGITSYAVGIDELCMLTEP